MQAVKKPVSAGYRLDPKVIITMSVVALLSLGIFGFRYMTNKPCTPVQLSIDATNFYTGTPIRFSSTAGANDKSEWSVGDPEGKILTGQTVVYTYAEPGQYMIELTVNGRCKEYKYVTIEKAPKIIDPDLIPRILCPTLEVEIGKPVSFKDSTLKATSWEWRFGETGAVDAITQIATYTFTKPGLTIVTLVINGNPDLHASCRVFVKDKPVAGMPGGGPAVPNIGDMVKSQPETEPINDANKPPAITDKDFSAMLQEVVKGKQFASGFTTYLCDYLKMPVKYKVEGEREKTISFEEMCADLKGMKRVKKIISTLNVDQVNGCIVGLSIKVDRRTF